MSAEPAFSFALKYNNSVSFKNFQVGGAKINGDLATNGKEIAVLTTVKIGCRARFIGRFSRKYRSEGGICHFALHLVHQCLTANLFASCQYDVSLLHLPRLPFAGKPWALGKRSR